MSRKQNQTLAHTFTKTIADKTNNNKRNRRIKSKRRRSINTSHALTHRSTD